MGSREKKAGALLEAAKGLRKQPAYALIFSICTLSGIGGAGTGISGALNNNVTNTVIGFLTLLAMLFTSYMVVRVVEKRIIVDSHVSNQPNQFGKNISDEIEEDLQKEAKRKLVEHRPIKRLHYTTRVSVGDYHVVDIGYQGTKISIKNIELASVRLALGRLEEEKQTVRINIDNGGGIIHGGICTKYVNVNEYLVPQRSENEEVPYSLFYFINTKEVAIFFRIFVTHINDYKKEVDLEVSAMQCNFNIW